jgi:hypothetical protein
MLRHEMLRNWQKTLSFRLNIVCPFLLPDLQSTFSRIAPPSIFDPDKTINFFAITPAPINAGASIQLWIVPSSSKLTPEIEDVLRQIHFE